MDHEKKKKKVIKKVIEVKNYVFSKDFVKAVLLGQLLSLLICGTALTSGILQENQVYIPTGQSSSNYILLALLYIPWNFLKVGWRGVWKVLRVRWWWYLLIGVLEVEANFMIVKAYQLTSVTSVQLLDCLAIPTIILLSRRFLKATYLWGSYAGVVVCLAGAGLLVAADVITNRYHSTEENGVAKIVVGDLLVIGGSLLYGGLNVAQEVLVRRHGALEYLSMVATVASVVSVVQFCVLERHELANIHFSHTAVWFSLLLFTACMFAFYNLTPYVIKVTSAVNVNLNLLSSDLFSLVIGIFIFQYKLHFLHFISFIAIITGVIIYNVFAHKQASSSSPPPSPSPVSALASCGEKLASSSSCHDAFIINNPSALLSSPTSSSSIHKCIESPDIIVTSF